MDITLLQLREIQPHSVFTNDIDVCVIQQRELLIEGCCKEFVRMVCVTVVDGVPEQIEIPTDVEDCGVMKIPGHHRVALAIPWLDIRHRKRD